MSAGQGGREAAAGAAAALLMIGDGRFPAGGYAHSGGLEPLIAAGQVRDLADLEAFLTGRAATVGLVTAAFAAAACRATTVGDDDRLTALDTQLDARTPSPAQRTTSRQLGRQLLRAMAAVAPDPRLDRLGRTPHHPLALGAACAVLKLGPHDAALAALHESIAGPAAAAVRLLTLDPFAAHAVLARLGPRLNQLADTAAEQVDDLDRLPAPAAPLLDIAAERHTSQPARLFAS